MTHTALRPALAAFVGLALLTGAGCNIVGPALFFVAGPEKTQALYELPEDKPMVVFIDDRSSVLPSRAVRQRIAHAVERTLLEGDAVPKSDVISSDAIAPIASAERFSRPKSIADVGEAVAASTVVYATIDSFSLTQDGSQLNPSATIRVKVVDAKARTRLWPLDPEEWHTVSFTTPTRATEMPRTQTDRTAAEQELADRVGLAIGQLFVKHKSHPGSERIGSS